jgi:tyrosinase
VHVAVGGPSGLMTDPDTAALDPIFWLHHANIDRIWWLWQAQPSSIPTTGPAWTGQSFSLFDMGGAPASLADSGVLDTINQLDYTYDRPPIVVSIPSRWPLKARWPWPWPDPPVRIPVVVNPPDPGPERTLVGATQQPVRLTGTALRAPVTVDERSTAGLRAQASAGHQQLRAFLDIDDIEAEQDPGIVYSIYVNLPAQPTPEDLASHHVGNISLFGVARSRNPRGDEHAHGLHVSMEITPVLDELASAGTWKDGTQLEVTFLPQSLESPEGAPAPAPVSHQDVPVTLGRVSLHFA